MSALARRNATASVNADGIGAEFSILLAELANRDLFDLAAPLRHLRGMIRNRITHLTAADLYRNTALEEEPRFTYRQGLGPAAGTQQDHRSASDPDETQVGSATSSDSSFSPSRVGAAMDAQAEVRRQIRAQRAELQFQREFFGIAQADAMSDQLRQHYEQEAALRQAFTTAASQLSKDQPKLFAQFKDHMTNAYVASPSQARSHDILSWFRGLPAPLSKAIKELQTYYHKEAHLRFQQAGLEQRVVNGVDKVICLEEWSDDHQYAVDRRGKAGYGFETTSTKGYEIFTIRIADAQPARLVLRYLMAGVDVRIVRLEHAALNERYGRKKWEESVEKKVLAWIEAAEEYLAFRLNFVGQSAITTPFACQEMERNQAAVAFGLTADQADPLYVTLTKKLAGWRKVIQSRHRLVRDVLRLRAGHAKALDDAERAAGNQGLSAKQKGTADLEARDFGLRLLSAEKAMDTEYGRGRWEWYDRFDDPSESSDEDDD